jgi:hypothetical protein
LQQRRKTEKEGVERVSFIQSSFHQFKEKTFCKGVDNPHNYRFYLEHWISKQLMPLAITEELTTLKLFHTEFCALK